MNGAVSDDEANAPPPGSRKVPAIIFALLVLATIAAFAWAQRVKRDPLVLDRATFVAVPRPNPKAPLDHSFMPTDSCRYSHMRIRFRTTVSDRATVQIIEPGGRAVHTLARDKFLKRYQFHTFYWTGRQFKDGIAPPGRYKLRVKLLGEGRTLTPPGMIKLHRGPHLKPSQCRPSGRSRIK